MYTGILQTSYEFQSATSGLPQRLLLAIVQSQTTTVANPQLPDGSNPPGNVMVCYGRMHNCKMQNVLLFLASPYWSLHQSTAQVLYLLV